MVVQQYPRPQAPQSFQCMHYWLRLGSLGTRLVQQSPLHMLTSPKISSSTLRSIRYKSTCMEQAKQCAITNAAESILGQGVARPAGAPVRAHSVDTPIFAEMGIF